MPSEREIAELTAAQNALKTIAVTGTNGKTTTTSMIAAIVQASCETSAHLTTLGRYINGTALPAIAQDSEFLAMVRAATSAGAKSLALEVTSKALRGGWAVRWPAHVAVFTNLTRDHLDMHGTAEAYFAAKAQLFMHVVPGGHCVLNGDDENTDLLAEVVPEHATIHRYDTAAAGGELSAQSVASSRDGLHITLAPSALAEALGGSISLPAVGEVHAQNALAAALSAHCAGYAPHAIVRGLANFGGVHGRFEVVGRAPLTVIDYAHTPDGLRGTLRTARALVLGGGRLFLVFGCGGERDTGKRALMGAIAHELADTVVVTNDNPRREDPQRIAENIRRGARGPGATWSLCLARPQAIAEVVTAAHPDDVVVIAGKGHEQVQEIGTDCIPMCDRSLARAALVGREAQRETGPLT